MFELPKYIRGRIGFTVQELELLIEFICKDCVSIKMADRFIQARLTEYELLRRSNKMNDFEKQDYIDWKDVEAYFDSHKLSFERQYFKRKLWV